MRYSAYYWLQHTSAAGLRLPWLQIHGDRRFFLLGSSIDAYLTCSLEFHHMVLETIPRLRG
jgi:hypothetical protein